jgi:hypothetical protein
MCRRARSALPFREPLGFTVRHFLAHHRWPNMVLVISAVSVFGVALLIAPPALMTSIDRLLDSNYAGVLGVIIGAAIGGVTSYLLQLRQYQAHALSNRKNSIYEPLYNALLAFSEQLKQSPYPECIHTLPQEPVLPPERGAYLYAWTTYRQDHRYLQVPNWLARALDQFTDDLKVYNEHYREVDDEFKKRVRDASMQQEIWRYPKEFKGTSEILRGEIEKIGYPFGSADWVEEETDPHAFLRSLCLDSLDPAQNFIEFYTASIERHLDWLIDELAKVMSYIDVLYGSRNRLA